jgi:hypothetical protein
MNQQPNGDFQERRGKALERYRDELQWYEQIKHRQRRAYQLLQICVIVFSGLTPILILIDQFPKPLQALPAALAGMLAAILATFRLQDNYVRYGYTTEALKSELLKYETRGDRDYGPDVDDQLAFERFVSKMEGLIMAEVTDWRQSAIRKEQPAEQQEPLGGPQGA